MFQGKEHENRKVYTENYMQFSQSTKYKEGSGGRRGWRNKRVLVVKDLVWPKGSCTQRYINGFWGFDESQTPEIVMEICKLVCQCKCVLSEGEM